MCSFANIDPPRPHDIPSQDVVLKPLGAKDVSRNREIENRLMSFLKSHGALTCLAAENCLKRKRSTELHWTTDDKDIVHEARIGGGALGVVHRVLSPGDDC